MDISHPIGALQHLHVNMALFGLSEVLLYIQTYYMNGQILKFEFEILYTKTIKILQLKKVINMIENCVLIVHNN